MSLRIQSATAIITGASRGIGAAIALELSRRGCHLALVDVDRSALAETALAARAHGVRVSEHYLDVADAEAVAAFPEEVLRQHGSVQLLFNNAGVALVGTFEQISLADFEWLLGINLWGVVRMTKAFLPVLKSTSAAQIVNMSSLFGLIAPPGQSAYATSKFAVRGFSEALRYEMLGSSVRVTCVHPGGVRTAIADRARSAASVGAAQLASRRAEFARVARTTPETAARIIVDGVERRKPRILIGSDAVLVDGMQRLMPLRYHAVLRRILGRRSDPATVGSGT